jgi:hypothetical protein
MDHLYIALFGPGRGHHLPDPSDIEAAKKIGKFSILIFDESLNFEIKTIPDYKNQPVIIINSNKPRDVDKGFKIEDVDIRLSKKAAVIPIVFIDYMGHKHISEFMTYLNCGDTYRRWYILGNNVTGSINISDIVKEWASTDTLSALFTKGMQSTMIGAAEFPSALSLLPAVEPEQPKIEPTALSLLPPLSPPLPAVSGSSKPEETVSALSLLPPPEKEESSTASGDEEKKIIKGRLEEKKSLLIQSYSYMEGGKIPNTMGIEEQEYIYKHYMSVCRRVAAFLRAGFRNSNVEHEAFINETSWTMNLGTSAMMFFLKYWGLVPRGPDGETIDLNPIEEFFENSQYREAVTDALVRTTANFAVQNNLIAGEPEESISKSATSDSDSSSMIEWYDQNTWGMILRQIENRLRVVSEIKETIPRRKTPAYRETNIIIAPVEEEKKTSQQNRIEITSLSGLPAMTFRA